MLSFKRDSTGRLGDAIVRAIAERSAAATLLQLTTAAERMSPAELRGYVRALAWPWINAELSGVAISERHIKSELRELADRALEQTVYLVIRAYMASPVIALPTPHIGLRAAA